MWCDPARGPSLTSHTTSRYERGTGMSEDVRSVRRMTKEEAEPRVTDEPWKGRCKLSLGTELMAFASHFPSPSHHSFPWFSHSPSPFTSSFHSSFTVSVSWSLFVTLSPLSHYVLHPTFVTRSARVPLRSRLRREWSEEKSGAE